MTESQKIVRWNEERGLVKTPGDLIIENEMSYVVEEVIESMTSLTSKEARPYARMICKAIKLGNVKGISQFIDENNLDNVSKWDEEITPTKEQIVDACCDGKVFFTGTIRKAGYNPDIAMNEVQKEIDSRVGSVIDGKFQKDMSEEAQANWYKADFNKAIING